MTRTQACALFAVLAACKSSARETDAGGQREDAAAPAQGWSENARVNDDPTPEQQREVSLAVDSSGNWYAAWMDLRRGVAALNDCAFSGSTDGGVTWSPNELYKGPYNVCGDPVVAADDAGNLYRMVIAADFVLTPEVNPIASEIHLARSGDGGRSWGPWRTVVEANPPGPIPPQGLNDKPWMAARGGRVVVVWTVLDRFLFGALMFTRSDDGGDTWRPPAPIGQGVGACVVMDDAGRIHVAWGHDVDRKVQFTSSSDGGDSWSAVRDVADTGPTQSVPDDTSLIIGCAADRSGDALYLVWTGDLGGGSFDVWVARSLDAGATWAAPVKVNDDDGDARQTRAWIGVDASGAVHAAWMDWRSGAARAYASRSVDRGASWSRNELVSDGGGTDSAQDYNGLAVSAGGDVGFAWTDDRSPETGMDVYFSRKPAEAATR